MPGRIRFAYILPPTPAKGQWLKILAEALPSIFPSGRVQDCHGSQSQGSWQESIKEQWPLICQGLRDEFPFLQGFEDAISYQMEGNDCICIAVPSTFLVELLQQKLRQIENFSFVYLVKALVKLKAADLEWEDKWLAVKEKGKRKTEGT